jgi:parallel beta-helix repeat protein
VIFKRKKNIILLIISVGIILSLSTNLNNFSQVSSLTNIVEDYSDELDYTISSPIIIDEESDFTNLGFSGAGINGDPYLIKGLKIETTGDYAIQITGVTSAFNIEDCYIDGNVYGIYIEGPMYNKTIIRNNTVVDTDNGIYIVNLDDLEVVNNTCIDCGYASTRIYFCDGMKILNNTFIGSDQVHLGNAQSAVIANNTCTNTGFTINTNGPWYLNHEFTDNYVNGKPVLFLANPQDIVISDNSYSQVIVGDGNNVTVKDMIFSNTAIGVYLNEVDGMHVINCTIINATVLGIDVRGWNSLIEDCEVGFATDAIDVSTCTNNVIRNCYLYESGSGILAVNAPNVTCFNNTIENCYNSGIRFQSNNVGKILNNTITNAGDGLWFYDFEDCTIAYNNFENSPNSYYAIFLYTLCANNIIHNNFFLNNNPGGTSQVYDDAGNTWYDVSTQTGNYYSDYSGSGPYNVDGAAGSTDPYVITDSTSPTISSKSPDLEYIVGSTGNTIYWQASDQYPRYYQLLKNDTIFKAANWISYQFVSVKVDGLIVGTHNYTAIFYDRAGNYVVSTILVTVAPVISEYQNINVTLLSISILSMISISIILNKKK